MSILLEALRKTEKNQKKQQVPTIHMEEPSRPDPEPLKTGPLVAMIAVALVLSGWFTWRQYQLPEGIYQPPVTLAAGRVRSVDSTSGAEEPRVKMPPAPVESKPASAPSNPINEDVSKPPRTPVESFQAGTSSAESGQAVTAQNDSADSKPASSAATNRPQTTGAGRSLQTTSSQSVNTAAPAEQDTAHIPEPIGYWELPDAIRAVVPEIRFTVLVYNQDPAQRFVLIDGERLAEGDAPLPGLKVEEIRRDGVIFSYRLYQFLVER